MLLPLDMIVSIYMHMISAILIFGANVLSQSYVQEEIDIIHDDVMGRGGLYDSHIDFMKALKIEEKKLRKKYNKIKEAKTRLRKRIVKKL